MAASLNKWFTLGSTILVLMALSADVARASSVGRAEPPGSPAEAKYLFALAQELRQEADFNGAKEAFEGALAADPDEPYLRLSFAEFLYQIGDLDAASEQASVARGLGESPEALRLMARIELRRANKSSEAVGKAVVLFGELSELLPEDVESRVSSGRLLMSLGRFDEAAAPLRQAYDLRPRDVRLASMLMTAFQGSLDTAKAEQGLRELVNSHPEFLEARLALANLLVEQGRHADSVALLQSVPAVQNERVDLLRLLALELYRVGAWQKSLEASTKWLEIAPSETPAVYLNGLALLALARFAEAEAALRTVYEDDDTSLDVARALAEAVERQRRPAEATEILSRTAQSLEADGQVESAFRARLEMIDLEVRAQEWERVIDLTGELLASEQLTGRGELLLIRGQALLEAGNVEAAIALFGTLGEDGDVGTRARAHEGEALFRAGRVEAAEDKLLELAATGELEDVVVAARAFHRLELYEQATQLWLAAKRENPEALDVRFWLGSAYERSGRRESAVREFRDLLARDGLFAPALNYLGYMWAERGENLDEAVDLVKKAVALEPSNGAYVDSLGWVYFQLGEYEEALGHLEKASQLVGDDAVVFEHLGDLYAVLGRRSQAAESYQRAMALAGDNADAVRQKLARLNGRDDF